MCGRYYIAPDEDELEIKKIIEQINDQYKNTRELAAMKTGEIFPTDIVPVLTPDSPSLMKWGFPRFDGKGHIINARLETSLEKPMFRKPFMENRCLIPASHYFEWEKQRTNKQKYAIGVKEPLYMAGFYRYEKDFPLPLFVILTRPAASDIAFIHDRMPVILSKDMQEEWLSKQMDIQDVLNNSIENVMYQEI